MNKDKELEQRLGLEDGEWTEFCKMRTELATLHKVSRKSIKDAGLTLKDANQFVRDPRNFDSQQWQALEEFTKEIHLFKQKIFDALQISTKKKRRKSSKKAFEQKKKQARKMRKKISQQKMDSASKKRKKRTIGLKKAWMQM